MKKGGVPKNSKEQKMPLRSNMKQYEAKTSANTFASHHQNHITPTNRNIKAQERRASGVWGGRPLFSTARLCALLSCISTTYPQFALIHPNAECILHVALVLHMAPCIVLTLGHTLLFASSETQNRSGCMFLQRLHCIPFRFVLLLFCRIIFLLYFFSSFLLSSLASPIRSAPHRAPNSAALLCLLGLLGLLVKDMERTKHQRNGQFSPHGSVWLRIKVSLRTEQRPTQTARDRES